MEPNKLFVYGILKTNFSLDLNRSHYGLPKAKFIGKATLKGATLNRIGSGVGLRLEGEALVHGEVYEIPDKMWPFLDQIENHPHTYKREVVKAQLVGLPDYPDGVGEIEAWVYVHQHPKYFMGKIRSGNYTGTQEDFR